MPRQIFQYHPIIGYLFTPGLVARIPSEGGGYLMTINQSGFRCRHELTEKRPPGSPLILLFGDSFTAGDGVSDGYRFGDLLEQRLERPHVINLGLPGTGTDQQYLIFRELAKDLEYDLLLICPLVENIRRVANRFRATTSRQDGSQEYLAKPYFELVDGGLNLRHVPVPKGLIHHEDLSPEDLRHVDFGGRHRIQRSIVNRYLKPLKPIIQSVFRYQPVPDYDHPKSPAWLLMKAVFQQWIAESGDHPVVICPIPLYQHVEQSASADNYRKRFQELAEMDGVTVVDPLPRFWAEDPDSRRRCRFRNDPHLTPFGHQVLADALAPTVARLLEER